MDTPVLARRQSHEYWSTRLENDSSWTSIVERFLQAYYVENKQQREAQLTSSFSVVLREIGSEIIADSYFAKTKAKCQSLRSPSPSSEWKRIAWSEHSVLVEIPVDEEDATFSNQVPFLTTRFLLVKGSDAEWQIEDILQPCFSCNTKYRNRKTTAGQCSMCYGVGHLPHMEERLCTFCNGTGKCRTCENERIAGWRKASFLRSNP